MATSVAIAATVLASSGPQSEVSTMRLYRLKKSFAAVQFDADRKGRIIFLPEGAELRVVGSSCLCGCLEVLCENRLYSVFEVDLLGLRSVSMEPNRGDSGRIKTDRAIVAVGACA